MKLPLSANLTNDREHYFSLAKTLKSDLLESLLEYLSHPWALSSFSDSLDLIIKEKYDSPLSRYWVYQLDKFFYLIELLEILDSGETEGLEEDEVPTDEDLFEHWERSSMAQAFDELYKEKSNIIEVSKKLKTIQEEVLISFALINIEGKSFSADALVPSLLYQMIPELGDSEHSLTLGRNLDKFDLSSVSLEPPFVAIDSYNSKDQILSLMLGESIHSLKAQKHFLITSERNELVVINGAQLAHEAFLNWVQKLEKAIRVLQTHCPELYQVFFDHTKIIVGHSQEEMVSYSLQEMPGLSVLNSVNRDFVDTIDDLLHENGHHYLNTFLRPMESELEDHYIFEDDEKIFWSPWRNVKRPIRGLFHAYCTFTWAYILFYELLKSSYSGERDKILTRAYEEKVMLEFSYQELLRAKKLGKIAKKGLDLVHLFREEILKRDLQTYGDCPASVEKIQAELNHISQVEA